MSTNHYECTKCKKTCDGKQATEAEKAILALMLPDAPFDRTRVSQCHSAPMKIVSGKDW